MTQLFIRFHSDKYYLCNGDYSFNKEVSIDEDSWIKAANNLGVSFEFDEDEEIYHMNVRNPRTIIKE